MNFEQKKYDFDKYAGFLFDLDGTLVDLHIDWKVVRIDLLKVFTKLFGGLVIPGIGLHGIIDFAMENCCHDARRVASNVLKKHEEPASFDQIQEGIDLLLYVIDTKKIGIVTNNLHSTAKQILTQLGIWRDHFCIIGFDDVQKSKPHPEGILQAIKALHLERHQAVFIGDSNSDKIAAQKAQVDFIHISQL